MFRGYCSRRSVSCLGATKTKPMLKKLDLESWGALFGGSVSKDDNINAIFTNGNCIKLLSKLVFTSTVLFIFTLIIGLIYNLIYRWEQIFLEVTKFCSGFYKTFSVLV